MGRRKTWLIPSQLLIGATMIASAFFVDELVDGPDVPTLTALFIFIYTLCATQDIAVDGCGPSPSVAQKGFALPPFLFFLRFIYLSPHLSWALTMLSPKNVDKASVCNSVGQSLGYFVSFILFLILSDPKTCNKYLR